MALVIWAGLYCNMLHYIAIPPLYDPPRSCMGGAYNGGGLVNCNDFKQQILRHILATAFKILLASFELATFCMKADTLLSHSRSCFSFDFDPAMSTHIVLFFWDNRLSCLHKKRLAGFGLGKINSPKNRIRCFVPYLCLHMGACVRLVSIPGLGLI